MKIWILLVQSDFQAVGRPFSFDVESSDSVEDMKLGVKQHVKILANVDLLKLAVWKTKGKMILNVCERWETILKGLDIDVNDWNTIEAARESELVVNLGLSEAQILLIQMADQDQVTTIDDEVPVVVDPGEFKRYRNTVLTLGKPPSEGAKSTEYRKSQGDVARAIYDGRRGPDGKISTIAPPIQIFHPIFDDFTRFVNCPDDQPTVKDLKSVHDLMSYASVVRQSEDRYGEGLRHRLGHILDAPVHEDRNPDNTKPDGVIKVKLGDIHVPYVFLELKREIGEGGCDPTSQVSLSMRRSWIHASRQALREKCCCPTFLIAAGGAWLIVMGSVFSDKFIVQRLTDMRWMALSSMEEDSRVYHNARILVALRKCLKLLQKYYQDVDSTSPPFVPNQPHPRYFPYPTSFTTGDGTPTYFRYLKSLEDHPASVTYLAEITDQSGATGTRVKVVVKFVASYGEEVHKFLAQKGWAPTLLHYGPLRENTPPDGFLGPTGSAPPGLHLHSNLMSMVVMDYIDAQPKRPPNAHLQIKDVLTQLHINGYVFGDLRPPNVLFDADGKVKFIDFNWCGRYDRKICDEDLADGRQNQIEKMDCVQVGDGPYAYYPLAMSTIEDMWVPGMEPLAQIRPVHDIKMLDKFLW